MLSPETIKEAIRDLTEPVKFIGFRDNVEGANNPEFLRWDLEKFQNILRNEKLTFRTGLNARTIEPQWDMKCPKEHMTLSELLQTTESATCYKWYYFDYKYLHQLFNDRTEILKSIDWQRFGFDKTGNDSTIWIGSKGAHTNCHQDSYGCNLISQIHGRKQWLLFPPDSGKMIKPTRVPYEESTIYSKFNFFCPSDKDEEGIMRIKEKAKLVILEPGDVLLVPSGWWHYVESLDFSISINVWLPVDTDDKGRLKEALVKLLVRNIGEGIPSASQEEPQYTQREIIDLINICIEQCGSKRISESQSSHVAKRLRRTPWTAEDLANEYPNSVRLLQELSSQELRKLLAQKRERFSKIDIVSQDSDDNLDDSTFQHSLENIFNALCHVDVINKVADLLLD